MSFSEGSAYVAEEIGLVALAGDVVNPTVVVVVGGRAVVAVGSVLRQTNGPSVRVVVLVAGRHYGHLLEEPVAEVLKHVDAEVVVVENEVEVTVAVVIEKAHALRVHSVLDAEVAGIVAVVLLWSRSAGAVAEHAACWVLQVHFNAGRAVTGKVRVAVVVQVSPDRAALQTGAHQRRRQRRSDVGEAAVAVVAVQERAVVAVDQEVEVAVEVVIAKRQAAIFCAVKVQAVCAGLFAPGGLRCQRRASDHEQSRGQHNGQAS